MSTMTAVMTDKMLRYVEPEDVSAARQAARQAAKLTRDIEKLDVKRAKLAKERAEAWHTARTLGMSELSLAKIAGLHVSQVQKAMRRFF